MSGVALLVATSYVLSTIKGCSCSCYLRFDLYKMATSQEKVCSGTGSVNERTSQFYRTKELPERFENPSLFRGYDRKPQHPMYTTESSKYGSRAPTVHTVPLCFHATSQKFSQELGRSGMPRNYSLNTSMDKHYI